MTALAGEGQKIFMVAIPALHPGKAVVQVATFQVAVSVLGGVETLEQRSAYRRYGARELGGIVSEGSPIGVRHFRNERPAFVPNTAGARLRSPAAPF
jgi:hypothetical protein